MFGAQKAFFPQISVSMVVASMGYKGPDNQYSTVLKSTTHMQK